MKKILCYINGRDLAIEVAKRLNNPKISAYEVFRWHGDAKSAGPDIWTIFMDLTDNFCNGCFVNWASIEADLKTPLYVRYLENETTKDIVRIITDICREQEAWNIYVNW